MRVFVTLVRVALSRLGPSERWRPRAVVAASVAVVSAGCANETLPPPPANAATLIGEGGTYVRQVDDRELSSARVQSSPGGNTVRIAPGRHRVKVYAAGAGGRPSALWEFDFDAAPSTTYRLSPGEGAVVRLQVHDDSTGATRNVE
jgi:hypothetical protein